jgi:prophage antirepressor-like protein
MGLHLDERKVSKLDEDQRQTLEIRYHGQPENMLMLSESGVYALLVYHYTPGHRLLREWLTHQVVPTLRDEHQSMSADRPMLSLLDWPEMSLSLLHWQDEGWIRLRDMPYLLLNRTRRRAPVSRTWLQKVAEYFHSSGHSAG